MTLDAEWARCRPWIEAALAIDTGGRTIQDIEREIESGGAFLLAGKDSAMVCEVIETKSLHVSLAGGNLQELQSGVPQLADLALAFGCGVVTVMGRRGWERALRDQGFRMLLVKDVSDER